MVRKKFRLLTGEIHEYENGLARRGLIFLFLFAFPYLLGSARRLSWFDAWHVLCDSTPQASRRVEPAPKGTPPPI